MRAGFEQGSDTRPATHSTTPDATLAFDTDGHGPFRDLCLIYGDFHRPVFLQEIINWFVRSASKTELAALRKAISLRSTDVGRGGKRGRPRGRDDADWLVKAKEAAWHRIVDGWTWKKIAEFGGLKPNQRNIRTIERTLARRHDQYAAVIWKACVEADVWRTGDGDEIHLQRLESALGTMRFKQLVWIRGGLFGPSSDPGWICGCKNIVLALAPRGGDAAGKELVQFLNYRSRGRCS